MIFGTIPELNVAPTALLSLLTFSYTNDSRFGNENAAILLCFLSGIIELLCGLLHLGFLIDFVSTPVVAGFTSAAALTIAFSQVKNLLGLKFQAETMIDVLKNIFMQIGNTKFWDATLGICCCLFLLGFRELKKLGASPQDTNKSSFWRKFIWFLSVSRNALVVVICAVLAFILTKNDIIQFSLTSEVEPGFPTISPPLLSYNNGTHTTLDMITELGSGVLIIPLIAILSNVAIAKAFANGQVVNASQEMIAVGICNIVGAFVGSMPVNASFSRGAVSNASGVRTPISGLYTGILVILALGFLTPYFSYIPKATLASVIVIAVIFMVEIDTCRSVWKINRIDFIPMSITFLACLILGIEVGILSGIAVNLAMVLYFSARPTVALQSLNDNRYVAIAKIETSLLLYPSTEFIKDNIMTKLSKSNSWSDVKVLVLDCAGVCIVDFTTAKCLVALSNEFCAKNKKLVIYNLKPNLNEMLLRASDNFIIINSRGELESFVQIQHENDYNSNAIQKNKAAKSEINGVAYVNETYNNDENDINGFQRTLV